MEDFKMFDIVYVDLADKVGSEQSGIRPCVIIQNDIGNKYCPTVIAMCLTSSLKKENMPTHCIIKKTRANGLKVDSMLMAETLCQISKERIIKKIGCIDNDYDKNRIINAYLANITGRKNYSSGWSKVVYAVCKLVIKGEEGRKKCIEL